MSLVSFDRHGALSYIRDLSGREAILNSELDDRASHQAGAASRDIEDLLGRIAMDPRICGGRPCIRGTRMRVSDIVGMMANGAAPAEIVADFPYLSEEDIAAALAYAARATDHRVIQAA